MNEYTELEDGTLDLNHECKFTFPETPVDFKPCYGYTEYRGKCKCGSVKMVTMYFDGSNFDYVRYELINNE